MMIKMLMKMMLMMMLMIVIMSLNRRSETRSCNGVNMREALTLTIFYNAIITQTLIIIFALLRKSVGW